MIPLLGSCFLAVLCGCGAGYLYGLALIVQRQKVVIGARTQSTTKFWSRYLGMSIIRMGAVTTMVCYLLPLPRINLILVMGSFLVFFWIAVIRGGGCAHG